MGVSSYSPKLIIKDAVLYCLILINCWTICLKPSPLIIWVGLRSLATQIAITSAKSDLIFLSFFTLLIKCLSIVSLFCSTDNS
jgi:hypothetical protein